jgi:glycosyltransferase involved in cell wall biosynthesis
VVSIGSKQASLNKARSSKMLNTMTTSPSAVPRVSVVMAVGRDLRFLDEAVDSILRQDFNDFEFVIVDDGTGADAVFARLSERDPRIHLVINPTNVGAAVALNRGIAVAKGDIIVRLDADDIAEPRRLGQLVAALDADRDLGLVGSWFTAIDETGMPHGDIRAPESDLEIRWTILFYIPFCHSSVAYRRHCFEAAGQYPIDKQISEDHYLWANMLEVTRARNIPEVLVRYRSNSRGLTATAPPNWRARTHQIREKSWDRLGIRYDLYDDSRAGDIAQFISGSSIARVAGRPAAYRTVLMLLRRFLVETPRARAEDKEVALRLAKTTIERIFADPPRDLRSRIAIGWLAWRLDPWGAIAALRRQLGGGGRKGDGVVVSIGSKLIRELKRPFTESRRLRREVETLRAELASVRSEMESMAGERALFESSVRAELLAQARSLEIYRDLAEAALKH